MLGFFNYTVWLTYASVLFSVSGIFIGLTGKGHPFMAMLCLLASALCDAFDGRVARSKKNRTEKEKAFGIEIDSFADTLAFGVLPAALVFSMARTFAPKQIPTWLWIVFYVVAAWYILAAIIRLAAFNEMAEEDRKEGRAFAGFIGLPVSVASAVFPSLFLLQCLVGRRFNLFPVNIAALAVMGFLFLFKKFHMKKPGLRAIVCFIILGLLEIAAVVFLFLHARG